MRNFKNLCLACALWGMTCVLCILSCFIAQVFAYDYSRSLDEALSLILQDDYAQAIDECQRLERYSKQELKGEILYLEGTCFMKLDMYEDARKVFKKAIPFAKGNLVTEVYMGIADSYFMQKKYGQAVTVYEQIIDKTKNDEEFLAALYYKLGKSYQNESEWAKTKYYFDLLKTKYPDSFELELVKKNSVGGNFFTIQVGCFSNLKNAEKLQSDLKAKGYDVYVTPFNNNGQQLYRVRVGEFMSRLAAEHTEAVLQSQEQLPTHIFP
ncbi:MAG: SPOR domain-containing protein [Candidatus Omnitrophota bacterium]